ncbi:MAG: DUF4198 domain-containing protein [Phenylobacterium sp.]|jgi:uncharacterized GH25 family protein|uniref:DUF4198 domain-containing protein n=1 Tax=Phenylobacterium sp. TaxID=1871053 RepID=UPI002A368CA6|nr:DUF4198 domain-containing protein [Phenylobacterium sp.]MDX9998005.1 DUF4198 domain-containing protein [Phenylobacterium sp.]
MADLRSAAGLALGLAALLAAPSAQAHRMWMTPSATVLSGEEAWVTVDAAVSNTLFHPDHVPMRLDGVTVVAPDGSNQAPENPSTGKYRSVFDARLARPGTYKIVSTTEGAMASYKVGGETKRWRGPAAELKAAIPEGAAEVRITENQRRVETFVTLGAPTTDALKPTGRGLELEPISHPNDLVAGEPARFRLLLDGKPAAGVEVDVVPGGARYRTDPGEMNLKTGEDGVVEITWPGPGMYWLEATARGGEATIPGAERSAGYVATLEVLPD